MLALLASLAENFWFFFVNIYFEIINNFFFFLSILGDAGSTANGKI